MEGNFIIRAVHVIVLLSLSGGVCAQDCTGSQCSFDELDLPSDISSSPEQTCYNVSDRVNFTCQGGLSLGGPPHNICENDGSWKYSSSPFCEDVSSACTPHSLENGNSSAGPNADSTDGYTPFEVIEYSCDEGYVIQGPSSATCELGGQWNPASEPECLITCGEALNGINGEYTSSAANFTVGATVKFDCSSGFSTDDETFLTCQEDGTWSADGPNCTDIDECDIGSHDCSATDNEVCVNTAGSFQCDCAIGHSRDGSGDCTDIDECDVGSHDCSATDNEVCVNTAGSFQCDCAIGYSRDGSGDCTDIDECDVGIHDCSATDNEVCVNTAGSFQCDCATGYSRDESGNCTDEVSLECGPNSFKVTINLEGLGNVNASSIALMGDQSCRAIMLNHAQLVIENELTACGTSVKVTEDYVEYMNVVIDADDADISAPDKILIPFTCSYSKTDTLNPRSLINDFKVVRKLSRVEAAKFDFLVYDDDKFLLPLLDASSLLDFTRPIYLEVKAEYSGDVRAGAEQCWATDGDGEKRVQLITNGCPVNDSLVSYRESGNPANFRFIVSPNLANAEGATKGLIHCDVIACDPNNNDSICNSSCSSLKRRKRSLSGFVHATRLSVGL